MDDDPEVAIINADSDIVVKENRQFPRLYSQVLKSKTAILMLELVLQLFTNAEFNWFI